MDVEPHTISYSKNGNDLGTCFEIEKGSLEGKALFPHVLSKNCELEINFGQKEEPFFPVKEGFTFINDVPVEERTRGTLPPEKKEDCEVSLCFVCLVLFEVQCTKGNSSGRVYSLRLQHEYMYAC